MTPAEELELLRLRKRKALAAQPAQPARVFTGAEERAAEDRKLVEELGQGFGPSMRAPAGSARDPLSAAANRALLGIGKGMFSTHLNISDLLSNLPGNAGAKPNWDVWNQEQALYDRTLGQDTAAGLGDLTGQTAMLAPLGGATGSLARTVLGAVLPQALAAAAPVLTLGAEGLMQGLVAAGPENRGEGAMTGLKLGSALPVVGPVLSRALQAASGPLKAAGVGLSRLLMPGTPAAVREEALKAGAIRMGGTAEGAAERLAATRESAGKGLSDVVSQMETGGGRGVDAGSIQEALLARGREVAPNTMNPAAANAYSRAAARIAERAGDQPTLGLTQGEALKRSLQEGIPYGKPGAKETVRAQKEIAAMFREAQERAVAEAGTLNPELADLAAQYLPAKARTGRLIEGAKAAAKAAKPGLYGRIGDLMALGSAATGGMMHHGPAGALWALPGWAAEHVARTRGPSTLAAGAYGMGRFFEGLGRLRPLQPPSGFTAPMLSRAGLEDDPRTLAQLAFGNAFARPQMEAR